MKKLNEEEWKRFRSRVKKINEERNIIGVAFFSTKMNVVITNEIKRDD